MCGSPLKVRLRTYLRRVFYFGLGIHGSSASWYHSRMTATPLRFFVLALPFVAVHLIAMRYFLYFYVAWFDIFMHTWGGFLTIMGFMMLGGIGSRRLALSRPLMLLGLAGVMAAWEVFEYVYGIAGTHPSYLVDTSLDVVVGAVGGVLALLVFRRRV